MTDHQQPMSAEDRFASAVEEMENKPEPAEQPKEVEPERAERTRNADGTFARKEETAETPKAPQPFDGFENLDPAVQAQFRRLQGERDDFRTRYTRQLGHTRALATRGSAPAAANKQQLDDARKDASGMSPGPARDAVQRQLDKWEAHVKQYPEDSAAIDEKITAMRDDIAAGINPLLQEVQQLRSVVQELRGGFDSVQAERAERAAQASQSILDQEAGDNWRQIAGWEDDNGSPVPPEKRTYHPEFVAWVEGHDPDVQQFIQGQLAHASPRVVAQVFRQFNQDRFGLDQQEQPPSRRTEALRDVSPTPGGSAKAPQWQGGMTPEDQFAAVAEAIEASRRR